LLATGVAVDLPQTKAGQLNIDQKPVAIAIDEKGQIFLMDQPIELGQLVDKLKETAKQGFDERIYLRGSKAVNYGRIAEIMSLITTAGYKKVALVTEQEKK
jgi:biopolymer transport protein TolR